VLLSYSDALSLSEAATLDASLELLSLSDETELIVFSTTLLEL